MPLTMAGVCTGMRDSVGDGAVDEPGASPEAFVNCTVVQYSAATMSVVVTFTW